MQATLGPYQIEVAEEFGPRITSLRRDDGPEQLAVLGPEVTLDHAGGSYVFRGGHRLWAAPEIAEVTYAPDDHPCDVSEGGSSLIVRAPADAAGLVKEIEVTLDGESLIVDHRLSGDGFEGEAAPWAITQMPMGGVAILPLVGGDTGPQANRHLVFWPYSSVEDRRVTLGNDSLELQASDGPRLKFGAGPDPGCLGYFLDGYLFVKEIEPAMGDVPDFGANAQVYVEPAFCELESLGGTANLGEGKTELRERWTIHECGDLEEAVSLTVG